MKDTDKTIQRVGTFLFIGMASFAIVNNYWAEPTPPRKITPTVTVSVDETAQSNLETELVVETMEQAIEEPEPQITEQPIDEIELLARCIEAEAGTQSLLGKRLVADVILNRVASPAFPNTIAEVIYQEGQFAVVANGTINTVTPSAETYQAINLEMTDRIDSEIVYFQGGNYGWGTPYEHVGQHYFSTL